MNSRQLSLYRQRIFDFIRSVQQTEQRLFGDAKISQPSIGVDIFVSDILACRHFGFDFGCKQPNIHYDRVQIVSRNAHRDRATVRTRAIRGDYPATKLFGDS